MSTIKIYTDASQHETLGFSTWAFSVQSNDYNVEYKCCVTPRPVKTEFAELLAIEAALKYIQRYMYWCYQPNTVIEIYSDSASALELIYGNNPLRKPDADTTYLLDSIKELSEGMQLVYTHVRAHAGNKGNEAVDKLCTNVSRVVAKNKETKQ